MKKLCKLIAFAYDCRNQLIYTITDKSMGLCYFFFISISNISLPWVFNSNKEKYSLIIIIVHNTFKKIETSELQKKFTKVRLNKLW